MIRVVGQFLELVWSDQTSVDFGVVHDGSWSIFSLPETFICCPSNGKCDDPAIALSPASQDPVQLLLMHTPLKKTGLEFRVKAWLTIL